MNIRSVGNYFRLRKMPIRQASKARKTGAVRADFGRRMRLSMGVGKARFQRQVMAGSCTAPRLTGSAVDAAGRYQRRRTELPPRMMLRISIATP